MKTTLVYTETGTNLKIRTQATFLANEFRELQATVIHYNVASVTVMSRSFADQLHKEIQALRADGITVIVENKSPQVTAVLNEVAQTQTERPLVVGNFIHRSFTMDDIEEFRAILDGKLAY